MFRWDLIPKITVKQVAFSKSGNSPEHDPILLPTGRSIGETGIEELRGILARFGIEGAWTEGRTVIVRRYCEEIKEIYDAAGVRAVREYLENKQKESN